MNLFFETCDFLRKQGDLSILNFFLGKRELKKLKTIFSDTVFFALFTHVQINGKYFPLKFRISCTLLKNGLFELIKLFFEMTPYFDSKLTILKQSTSNLIS